MPSALMGLVTSDNTQAPLGGSQIDAAIDALEPFTVTRWATSTARDTALPAGSRKAGMVSFCATVGYLETILTDGGSWVPLATRDTFSGSEPVLAGSAPPAGKLKIRREGTSVLTVQSGSFVTLSFPAYANGLVTAIPSVGDVASDLGMCIISNASTTLSSINVVVRTYAGATIAAGNIVRINWLTVGW